MDDRIYLRLNEQEARTLVSLLGKRASGLGAVFLSLSTELRKRDRERARKELER